MMITKLPILPCAEELELVLSTSRTLFRCIYITASGVALDEQLF